MTSARDGLVVVTAAKGGQGTSVVAAGLALLAAERRPTLLVDLAGDQPHLFGHQPPSADLEHWLDGDGRHPDSLARLETPVAEGLTLLSVADGMVGVPRQRTRTLARMLAADERCVIVDYGVGPDGSDPLGDLVSRTLQVIRPCYLALRAARRRPTPDGLIVVNERGRLLTRRDVADAIGAPVVCELWRDPAVARAVDAGLLGTRTPRSLRPLEALL